jgi:hypothetical protein
MRSGFGNAATPLQLLPQSVALTLLRTWILRLTPEMYSHGPAHGGARTSDAFEGNRYRRADHGKDRVSVAHRPLPSELCITVALPHRVGGYLCVYARVGSFVCGFAYRVQSPSYPLGVCKVLHVRVTDAVDTALDDRAPRNTELAKSTLGSVRGVREEEVSMDGKQKSLVSPSSGLRWNIGITTL